MLEELRQRRHRRPEPAGGKDLRLEEVGDGVLNVRDAFQQDGGDECRDDEGGKGEGDQVRKVVPLRRSATRHWERLGSGAPARHIFGHDLDVIAPALQEAAGLHFRDPLIPAGVVVGEIVGEEHLAFP